MTTDQAIPAKELDTTDAPQMRELRKALVVLARGDHRAAMGFTLRSLGSAPKHFARRDALLEAVRAIRDTDWLMEARIRLVNLAIAARERFLDGSMSMTDFERFRAFNEALDMMEGRIMRMAGRRGAA